MNGMEGVKIGHKISRSESAKLEDEMVEYAVRNLLVAGKDYDVLDEMRVVFGFLYYLENQVIAMFKIITDKTTVYFAKQLGSTSRLDDNKAEQNFCQMVEMMKHVNGRHLKVNWKA